MAGLEDPWTRHTSSKTNTSTKKKHWYYQIKQLGFKYNMNDLMASIGIIQLKKLRKFNKLRNDAIKKYLNGIKNLKKISPSYPHINKNIAYWMFSIRVKQRDKCIEYLKKRKISTSVVWMPLNLHPIYKKYKYSTPNALKVWKELITLPLYSDIKTMDINYIVKCLKEYEKNLK
jgi:Predicted pyridoxal phosphate-dependent enzyme apparently involved in regulation of cell wall biogenesis